MEKPKELIIEPKGELRFIGPFSRPAITLMKITNPTDNIILFKIKTTAPKRYCVRPNFGSLEPHSNAKIEICLQPFVYDPNDKNKHKFMVQSLVVLDNSVEDWNKLWKESEPHQLMDVKLRCVFEVPTVTSADSSGTSGLNDIVKEATAKTIESENKAIPFREEKVSNVQPSDQREEFLSDLRRLREDNEKLQREKRHLTDEIVKIRDSYSRPVYDQAYTPILGEKQIPVFYIALSIVAAIFGFLFGKYF
ncbi:vesicle-associated membrane protein/synaptobrevin-binding protein isoform X1 [Zeugodacus cucurbitae]|uniref:Vesicle-associated membrane protein/synaptobrevin-binding protein n=2 Tax=Zeugodacus cucurbitae TaxID=28588 RepID=A0A0A1XQK1_ZEUCU|nr:vesicle-associated membrane protein/synaptobrevin-binding protein isoform X1 [Zeugodacus cucurbitae]